ncbi:MAG: HAD-IC family P-type ATPase [Patescibacteria group bacterium]|jgi:Ca2+-transporting ATPase
MTLNFDRHKGLSPSEVIKRQNQYGSNVLFAKQKKGFFRWVLKIFQEPMLLLLLATAIIYFLIGKAWDGVLMIAGVLLMIAIDLYQEAKTDKALEALKELSTPKINVIRSGKLQTINNQELVKGDLLVIREGERVAGDGQILESSNLSVDESMLTGESGAIFKSESAALNQVFAGTLVLSGQAVVKVASIGSQTQYGKIGKSLAQITESPTPLQKKTARLVKIFGLTGLAACAALFFINLFNTRALTDSLLKGLTLAISVIPEELPVILTVFSALGAYRLTKRKILIKRINSIETLGSMTTLCTDKTGTLTLNRMELHVLATSKISVKTKSLEKNPENLAMLEKIALACPAEPFDPADL